jgi:allophanate hydrolase
VSIFALTVEDACQLAAAATGPDPADPRSCAAAVWFDWTVAPPPPVFHFAVPGAADLQFFGDREAQRLFAAAVERFVALGGTPVAIDLQPFLQTARLLYDGPWVAERLAPFQDLVARPDALLPVIREILQEGTRFTAVDLFQGLHELDELRARTCAALAPVQFLLVPSTPTIYTVDEILARPRELNARLGLYTNFVNLLQLCALAVPNGFRADGLPSGVTLIGLPDGDARLATFGAAAQRALGGPLGATGQRPSGLAASAAIPGPTPTLAPAPAPGGAAPGTAGAGEPPDTGIRVAVVGAHLTGQPLNHQLTELGARLVRACRTAPRYRLYALPATTPPKPGLLRSAADADGAAIEVEVWRIDRARFGDFFAKVPAPLCLGTVELEDGETVSGFLCEPHATLGARDISALGGWRKFLATTVTAPAR